MSGLVLRPATVGDAIPLSTLEAQSTSHPWSALQYRDSVTAGHNIDVALLNGKIAGTAVWMLIVDEVDLLNIFIGRTQQGQGLGRQLLQQVIAAARNVNARRIVLEVRRSNQTAQQLYRSSGFSECGLRKNYYRNSDGREDAILMELAL